MFDKVVLALTIAICLYVAYLLVKAYMPSLFKKKMPTEPFAVRAMGAPQASPINTPPRPTPAPAPPIEQQPPQKERVVSPGGPGAPNATALPDTPAAISPEVQPIDPYEGGNMEAPIHDSMRFPELSFGPGVENKGVVKAAASGVANARGVTSESPFSPEFAQNGGVFMGSVSANDLSHDDTYANA
jgi:hypothetical protein